MWGCVPDITNLVFHRNPSLLYIKVRYNSKGSSQRGIITLYPRCQLLLLKWEKEILSAKEFKVALIFSCIDIIIVIMYPHVYSSDARGELQIEIPDKIIIKTFFSRQSEFQTS